MDSKIHNEQCNLNLHFKYNKTILIFIIIVTLCNRIAFLSV